MRALRLSLLLLAVIASVGSIRGPENTTPDPDSCSNSSVEGVAAVTILTRDDSGVEREVVDYQVLPIIFGSQGGLMLRMRFRVDGDAVPECVLFSALLDHCLDLACEDTASGESDTASLQLFTYVEGQSRATQDYYWVLPYPFYEGNLARLQVRVGSASKQVLIWLDRTGALVNVDGGIPDAGTADARPADAGLADANSADAAADAGS